MCAFIACHVRHRCWSSAYCDQALHVAIDPVPARVGLAAVRKTGGTKVPFAVKVGRAAGLVSHSCS
jgi:hypothetical protein